METRSRKKTRRNANQEGRIKKIGGKKNVESENKCEKIFLKFSLKFGLGLNLNLVCFHLSRMKKFEKMSDEEDSDELFTLSSPSRPRQKSMNLQARKSSIVYLKIEKKSNVSENLDESLGKSYSSMLSYGDLPTNGALPQQNRTSIIPEDEDDENNPNLQKLKMLIQNSNEGSAGNSPNNRNSNSTKPNQTKTIFFSLKFLE